MFHNVHIARRADGEGRKGNRKHLVCIVIFQPKYLGAGFFVRIVLIEGLFFDNGLFAQQAKVVHAVLQCGSNGSCSRYLSIITDADSRQCAWSGNGVS